MQQTPNIWLIDDDESTLDIVTKAFDKEQLTCQLKVFDNPRTLLSEIEQVNVLPSLLLVDYAMPGINGLQLIEQLKNSPHTQPLKTILFSRHITADMINSAQELNTYQVTSKPTNFGAWRELVSELCSAGFFS